jgi:hypothetical protein
MPIKVTVTLTRPSGAVRFSPNNFWKTPEVISHLQTVYENTGKLLFTTSIDLPPGGEMPKLTNIWIEYWDSQESVDQYWSDPMFTGDNELKKSYKAANNIVTTIIVEQISESEVPTVPTLDWENCLNSGKVADTLVNYSMNSGFPHSGPTEF